MRQLIPTLIAVLLVAAGGCNNARVGTAAPAAGLAVPIGSTCIVQFRRDALGSAAALPVSPLTTEINGATLSVSGKLLRADVDWAVLEREGEQLWIQHDSVLLLRFPSR
jgi:hypothetical protein